MRGQRGTTIIEVMIAATVLLVAMVGLVAVMLEASRATAVSHRRTASAFFRQAIADRFTVTARDRLAALPANTWVVDSCYDVDARLTGTNGAWATDYVCPGDPVYRTWVRSVPALDRTWALQVYSERIDGGCTPETRFQSIGCVAADLLLSD